MKTRLIVFISLLLVLSLTACGEVRVVAERVVTATVVADAGLPATETATPLPTIAPTEPAPSVVAVASQITLQGVLTPTQTLPPVAERPAATATPTPMLSVPTVTVLGQAVNVRTGPGVAYPVVAGLRAGATAAVSGRTADMSWLQVVADGRTGWLARYLVAADDAMLVALPIVQVPPPPTAVPPTALPPMATRTHPTATATAPTPPPSITPAPTVTPAIVCDVVPVRGFGVVWANHPELHPILGCPNGQTVERGTPGAIQTFERGTIIWLADDGGYQPADPYFILFDDGTWAYFPEMGGATEVTETPPPGLFKPEGRFARVWLDGTGARVRERLGWATAPARESNASVQGFWNGRMIWLEATDWIYIPVERWSEAGRQRIWFSFEDTFGD